MTDLYLNPARYGINDVSVEGDAGTFLARIYYPSDEGSVFDVPIRAGTYPLVAFAHGQRRGGGVDAGSAPFATPGCPADAENDFKRWSAVLHLLARCGFVVIAPALQDVIASSERSAARLEAAITWIRTEWMHRVVLWGREMFLDPDSSLIRKAAFEDPEQGPGLMRFGVRSLGEGVGVHPVNPETEIVVGTPTNLGVVGHSWGARTCAQVANRGRVAIRAIASIAGAWDETAAIDALIGARDPSLMMAGTYDDTELSYLRGLWGSLVRPKHQAALRAVGHWDWFGRVGGIQFCDPDNASPCRSHAWLTASELLVGFMTKYLYNRWQIPPYLLGDRFFEATSGLLLCGTRVRWDDPMTNTAGEKPWGIFPEDPW